MYFKGAAGSAALGATLVAANGSGTSHLILAIGLVLLAGTSIAFLAAARRRRSDRRSAG